MSKLRMMGAYFGAVTAGIAFFNGIMSVVFILSPIISGTIWDSPGNLFGAIGLAIVMSVLVFLYAIPTCLMMAAPFTLLSILFIGKLWAANHRNSIILGSLCPLVSVIIFTLIFVVPTTASPEPGSDTASDFLKVALAIGVVLAPCGAVAGSVFWRLLLRPKASSIQPVLQNQ
ncbi:hypothetical protein FS764_06470 [Agrobacterium vitis]|uniref:hypothetical protein n=1 Tax=Agrobacterium vitis TaxID=373 RepID=UPI001F3FBB54|nr:hypothetical protein [Agrobacterium vitis]MCF1466556.1 hypothetical protein [Agrobacterium vitis]